MIPFGCTAAASQSTYALTKMTSTVSPTLNVLTILLFFVICHVLFVAHLHCSLLLTHFHLHHRTFTVRCFCLLSHFRSTLVASDPATTPTVHTKLIHLSHGHMAKELSRKTGPITPASHRAPQRPNSSPKNLVGLPPQQHPQILSQLLCTSQQPCTNQHVLLTK